MKKYLLREVNPLNKSQYLEVISRELRTEDTFGLHTKNKIKLDLSG